MPRQMNVPNFSAPQSGTKNYSFFRGVDYSENETIIDDSRSPEALNMVADEGGHPQKRVGWRTIFNTGKKTIYGIFNFKKDDENMILYFADNSMYLYQPKNGSTPEKNTKLLDDVKHNETDVDKCICQGFYMNGKLWVLTGGDFIWFDGEKAGRMDDIDECYIPRTSYGRKALSSKTESSPGKAYEKVNMLTGWRTNSFEGVTGNYYYKLDTEMIDKSKGVEIKYYSNDYPNGYIIPENLYYVDEQAGLLWFSEGSRGEPDNPANEGTDNVYIKFYKEPTIKDGKPAADMIKNCRIFALYGVNSENRVFLSGNPDYPNMEFYSGLADPTYFPDINYIQVGSEEFAIQCYVKNNGELIAIKEDNRQEGTIWNHTAELSDDGTAIFPLKEGVAGYGCVARYSAQQLMDDPMYLSPRGILSPITQQSYIYLNRTIKNRSNRINIRLNKQDFSCAKSVCWNGLYILCDSKTGRCYVADSNQSLSDGGYEWYYWENVPATCFVSVDNELYFGTKDGKICKFNNDLLDKFGKLQMKAYSDDGAAVVGIWTTKLDDMTTPFRLKTMPKRGSGILIPAYTRSQIDIYICTEKDHGKFRRTVYGDSLDFNDINFKRFSFDTTSQRMIPFRLKQKKWKAIQIILKNEANEEGFGVFGAVIRFVFGNYAKR